jgi:putative phosphoribosyl transferase
MAGNQIVFADRSDAGRRLSEAMQVGRLSDPVIVALSTGGVPVAFEIAQRLGIPLDLLIIREIAAPGHPEHGIGAVVDGKEPCLLVDEKAARQFRLPPGYLDTEWHHQLAEVERRHRMYFGEDEPQDHDYKGRDIILVDDAISGIASIRAGIQALRRTQVGSIFLVVPVAPSDLLEELRSQVDDIVCLSTPARLDTVSDHYAAFDDPSDQEVVRLLKEARQLGRMLH